MIAIEESTPKQVRMAHLAMVGSHWINGVSVIPTNLTKASLVPDFYQFWTERVNNKTNGVTQRRWLLQARPLLTDLPAYLEAQERAGAAFNDPEGWARMAILNIARMGKFSSDRTVGEYARDIWGIKSV